MKVEIHTVVHAEDRTKKDGKSRFVRSADPSASYKVDKRVKRKN